MKRITAATLFALASIFVTGNAFSQNHEARVSVPFNFTVGNKALPTGNYSIVPVSDTIIQIRNTDTALLTQAAQDSNRSRNGGELVFDKAAGQYFLREILCESIAMSDAASDEAGGESLYPGSAAARRQSPSAGRGQVRRSTEFVSGLTEDSSSFE